MILIRIRFDVSLGVDGEVLAGIAFGAGEGTIHFLRCLPSPLDATKGEVKLTIAAETARRPALRDRSFEFRTLWEDDLAACIEHRLCDDRGDQIALGGGAPVDRVPIVRSR